MKKIFTFLIIISFLGCNNKKNEKELNLRSIEIKIDSLNIDFFIPKEYKVISLDELEKGLFETKKDDEYLLELMKSGIRQIKSVSSEVIIFSDKNNIENSFWIHSGNYLDFDKDFALDYLNMFKEKNINKFSDQGLNIEIEESSFFKTSKSKIIKLKFTQEYQKSKKYNTQYIVTSGKKTFGIMISNYENEDFEELIRML